MHVLLLGGILLPGLGWQGWPVTSSDAIFPRKVRVWAAAQWLLPPGEAWQSLLHI